MALTALELDSPDEQGKTNEGREAFRKAILAQDWDLLDARRARNAKVLLDKPLRQCQGHCGQAYSKRSLTVGTYGTVGCCYVCKMAIGFQEAAVDDLDKAKKINLKNRGNCPESCAEVPASGWCDELREPS